MLRLIALFFILIGTTAPVFAETQSSSGIAGLSIAEALHQGEMMYRKGILPSGEPMQATVQGYIPVEGTMFSCESCHLKSGLGSIEGTVISLPTSATELYKPFTKASEESIPNWDLMPDPIQTIIRRPAYTDKTLAIALWAGVDPGGRELNWTMPRYHLEDRDMEIMVFYLKHLSAVTSPGVTDSTLRFATVVTEDAPAVDREAMLAVLNAHVVARNSQGRLREERAKRGPFYHKKMDTAYRRMALDVWELKGAPETWRQQLENHYRKAPVFALLGGISGGEWALSLIHI